MAYKPGSLSVTFRMKVLTHPSSFGITSSSIFRQHRIQNKKDRVADSLMAPFFGVTVIHLFSLSPSFFRARPPSLTLCSFSWSLIWLVTREAGEGNAQPTFTAGQFRASHLAKTSDVKVSRALGVERTTGKGKRFRVSWKLCLHKDNADLL